MVDGTAIGTNLFAAMIPAELEEHRIHLFLRHGVDGTQIEIPRVLRQQEMPGHGAYVRTGMPVAMEQLSERLEAPPSALGGVGWEVARLVDADDGANVVAVVGDRLLALVLIHPLSLPLFVVIARAAVDEQQRHNPPRCGGFKGNQRALSCVTNLRDGPRGGRRAR